MKPILIGCVVRIGKLLNREREWTKQRNEVGKHHWRERERQREGKAVVCGCMSRYILIIPYSLCVFRNTHTRTHIYLEIILKSEQLYSYLLCYFSHMIKKRAASEIRRGRPFRTRNFITGPTDYLRFFSFGFFLNFFPTHSHFFYTLFNLLESVSRRFVEFSRYEAAGLAGLIENFV